MLILFLAACNIIPDNSSQKELREKLVEVLKLAGDIELTKADIDQAITEAASLGLQGEEKNWFVRSFLFFISAGKEIENNKQVYVDSQLRMLYEQTWQDLAIKRYGVRLDEERLQEII